MAGTIFKPDLNLQNLSMISIAKKLWNSQNIKHRIKNNFSGLDSHYPDANWCEISKIVVQHANSIILPANLSVLLKKTILRIGQKIYDWIYYVTKILKLDFIFTEEIYFSFGAVDEIKIFRFYWRNLKPTGNFEYQSKYFRRSPLFSLACMYGYVRFVWERKNEMVDELSESYPQIRRGDEIYNLISFSICMTAGERIAWIIPPRQRMFEVCLEKGYSKAARYFWRKLDEVERVSNLTNFGKKCLHIYDASFLMEKHCENLLFLINQMGEDERYLFFTDHADKMIKMFLPIWPYNELIVELLQFDWNVESYLLKNMANFLLSFSERMNRLELPLENELVFRIVQKAWGNIPVDKKLIFLRENQSVTSGLFLALNPGIVNLVLNDPIIMEVIVKEMDSFVKKNFVLLVKMGKFDFLNEIIETVGNFIPEPKEFVKGYFSNYKSFPELMENDESFGLVDQFFDFIAESEAERIRLKDKINTISVCRYLTEGRDGLFKFKLANKFLKWKFESDGEVKSFKEAMKSYKFVIVQYGDYVRIKSGDLSWLGPGDSLAMHPDEDLCNNADGLTFLKFEDATELNRGVVLGIKSFYTGVNYDFSGSDFSHSQRKSVYYVGTKAGDFVVYAVRGIWHKQRVSYFDLNEVVNLSNAFIKFYYETDEEVLQFKKTKLHVLVTENVIEFLFHALKMNSRVPETFLDDFCEFCMIPSEKIKEIKIQQLSDIEKFFDTYLIDQRNFELVDIYLYWLFGKVKRTEVCKKFLNSSNKGALLCVSYLKKQGGSNPLRYSSAPRICRWLSLVDDMDKLKHDVFALNERTPAWFPAFLDKLAHSDTDSVW